ncbi:GTF3C1; general transcription factor IIIC, polypeptide 1, alpha 220kDa [Ktedonobacter racemifer DSM 44963]|uniref:GTF3C1 general transcription factor IIIC, polypeptide 1, alpha 220kDa n=1 Tax=Ktedonobacter racemifer DSM 44963 TaxID=485913 RepID=D6U834_KTERA|nr:GTF3C1; general transcription factor IIIC, polypeptide 1, alpha 220kDa [Ktedonobacter racemifer DSM 44963]
MRRVVTSPHPFGPHLRVQLTAAPNHFGSMVRRSCRSSPTHATWPSGRSSTAGTSSSSLTWGSTSIHDTRGKVTVNIVQFM